VFANAVHLIILLRVNRGDLPQTQWERLPPLLPPQKPKTGRPAVDHRRMRHGIRWSLRPGAPWRDRPERDGPWRTVASRFYRWQKAGIWSPLVAAVPAPAAAEGQINGALEAIEGPMIRAHQHAAGAKKGPQRPKPSAGAGAVSAPQSTCGLQGAAT
jgi:transposase